MEFHYNINLKLKIIGVVVMLLSPLVFISFALGQLNCYKWPTAVKGIISPRPSIRKKVDFRPSVQKVLFAPRAPLRGFFSPFNRTRGAVGKVSGQKECGTPSAAPREPRILFDPRPFHCPTSAIVGRKNPSLCPWYENTNIKVKVK